MITPEDIRPALESCLGSVLTEDEWQFLIAELYVDEVVNGETGINGLAATVRRFRKTWRRAPSTRGVRQSASGANALTRAGAIARMLAADADREELVANFRRVHVADFPVDLHKVDAWIQRVAKADGPSTAYLSVKVPDGVEILSSVKAAVTKPPLTISEDNPGVMVQRVYLNFITRWLSEDEDSEQQIAVREGGTLDALRQVSQQLSRQFCWEEASATHFVLTGTIPPMVPIWSRGSFPSNYSSLARIVLTIDPALSPREVVSYYRARRSQLAGSRHRDLSEKHLQLAAFTSTRPEGESLRDRMNAWNDTHEQWRYEQETNFGRDCSQAVRRLLHPTYASRIQI